MTSKLQIKQLFLQTLQKNTNIVREDTSSLYRIRTENVHQKDKEFDNY